MSYGRKLCNRLLVVLHNVQLSILISTQLCLCTMVLGFNLFWVGLLSVRLLDHRSWTTRFLWSWTAACRRAGPRSPGLVGWEVETEAPLLIILLSEIICWQSVQMRVLDPANRERCYPVDVRLLTLTNSPWYDVGDWLGAKTNCLYICLYLYI